VFTLLQVEVGKAFFFKLFKAVLGSVNLEH
jgi:hypothetical protein